MEEEYAGGYGTTVTGRVWRGGLFCNLYAYCVLLKTRLFTFVLRLRSA